MTRLFKKLCTLFFAITLLTGLGCIVDPFSGSEVVLELGTANLTPGDIVNRPNQHYELFAVMDGGGLVSIAKFSINKELLALSYPDGDSDSPIGNATSLSSTGLPQSGIFLTTEANLENATGVLLSIETNGETDLAPERVVGEAEVFETNRSVLSGNLEGSVPKLGGGASALVDSRVAIILTEDRTSF